MSSILVQHLISEAVVPLSTEPYACISKLPTEIRLQIADFLDLSQRLTLASVNKKFEQELHRKELTHGWQIVLEFLLGFSDTHKADSALRALPPKTTSILLSAVLIREQDVEEARVLLKLGAKFERIHELLESVFVAQGFGPGVWLLLESGADPTKMPSGATLLLENVLQSLVTLRSGNIAFLLHAGACANFDQMLRGDLRKESQGRKLLNEKNSLQSRLYSLLYSEDLPEQYDKKSKLLIKEIGQ